MSKTESAAECKRKKHFLKTAQIDKIRKARDGMMMGMTWDFTPEGGQYWSDVHYRLSQLIKMAEGKL